MSNWRDALRQLGLMPHALTDPWFEAGFYCQATDAGQRIRDEDGGDIPFSRAQGLFLWCPCGIDQRLPDGALRYPLDLSLNMGRPHMVLVPFANPPSGVACTPGHGPHSRGQPDVHPRWQVAGGSGLADLTLAPSVDVGEPSCWHGHIQGGMVLP